MHFHTSFKTFNTCLLFLADILNCFLKIATVPDCPFQYFSSGAPYVFLNEYAIARLRTFTCSFPKSSAFSLSDYR